MITDSRNANVEILNAGDADAFPHEQVDEVLMLLQELQLTVLETHSGSRIGSKAFDTMYQVCGGNGGSR